jgi:hypothetical protein
LVRAADSSFKECAMARNPIVDIPKFGEGPLKSYVCLGINNNITLNNNVEGKYRAKLKNILHKRVESRWELPKLKDMVVVYSGPQQIIDLVMVT